MASKQRRVSKRSHGNGAPASSAGPPAESVDDLQAILDRQTVAPLDLFRRLYARNDERLWKSAGGFHVALTRRLISSGQTAAAFDYATRVLAHQDSPELRYQRALSLARGRNIGMARAEVERLLETLDGSKSPDPRLLSDVLSLSGRLLKDLARHQRDPRRRRNLFRDALASYGRSFRISGQYFPGINAATMAMLARPSEREARALARSVMAIATRQRRRAAGDDYWLQATLGEASVILRRWDDAAAHYRAAVKAAGRHLGDIASMRRNLQLLAGRMAIPAEVLDAVRVGPVVACSGHMIDRPGRRRPRFPALPALEERVRRAIADKLDAIAPSVGFCSGACGADLLFAEEMLRRGAELHVVLPFGLEDFHRSSVDFGLPSMRRWRNRCDDVLARATVHYATTERYLGDDVLFEFANRLMQGLTTLKAEELGVEAEALVVCEAGTGGGQGGAQAFLESWRAARRRAHVIDMAPLREGLRMPAARAAVAARRKAVKPAARRRRIQHMLFCDVKGFSLLPEEQARDFLIAFEHAVSIALGRARVRPAYINSWGDAVVVAFDHAIHCARFGTALLDAFSAAHWDGRGDPGGFTLRIGIHAGPVYRHHSHILRRASVVGSHVVTAARIEPVATPGCAFVSEHFAAELALAVSREFVCEYIGIHDLAKHYGPLPLYRLDRRWKNLPTQRRAARRRA